MTVQTPAIKIGDTVVVTDPEHREWYIVGVVDEMRVDECHVVEPNGATGWWIWSEFGIDVIAPELVREFRDVLARELEDLAMRLRRGHMIPANLIRNLLEQRPYTRGQRIGLEWVVTDDKGR